MSVPIQYVGSTDPYFETAVTGKPTKWTRGRVADVDEADALLLIQTGLFGAVPGGSSLDTRYTSALIAALAAAAGLTPRTWYAASDTGVAYWCSYASTAQPLSTVVHLGTITTAAMLAYSSPTEGMTCDLSDLDVVSSLPVRCIYTGGQWRLRYSVRMRLRGAGTATTSAQYPTNTRFGLPAGAFALCSGFDLRFKLALSDTPDTDTVTSWRIKLGSLGTASDATINSVSASLSAGDNQRAYEVSANFESATSVLFDGPTGVSTQAWTGSALTTAASAAVSLSGGDSTASALYLGLDYTMGAATNTCTTTMILTLHP